MQKMICHQNAKTVVVKQEKYFWLFFLWMRRTKDCWMNGITISIFARKFASSCSLLRLLTIEESCWRNFQISNVHLNFKFISKHVKCIQTFVDPFNSPLMPYIELLNTHLIHQYPHLGQTALRSSEQQDKMSSIHSKLEIDCEMSNYMLLRQVYFSCHFFRIYNLLLSNSSYSVHFKWF